MLSQCSRLRFSSTIFAIDEISFRLYRMSSHGSVGSVRSFWHSFVRIHFLRQKSHKMLGILGQNVESSQFSSFDSLMSQTEPLITKLHRNQASRHPSTNFNIENIKYSLDHWVVRRAFRVWATALELHWLDPWPVYFFVGRVSLWLLQQHSIIQTACFSVDGDQKACGIWNGTRKIDTFSKKPIRIVAIDD